jgi:hypothetical protein
MKVTEEVSTHIRFPIWKLEVRSSQKLQYTDTALYVYRL